MLDTYKKQHGDWETYEERFLELMAKRKIEDASRSASIAKQSRAQQWMKCAFSTARTSPITAIGGWLPSTWTKNGAKWISPT